MKNRLFTIIFGIILSMDLIGCAFAKYESIRYATKPAITISLLVFLLLQKKVHSRTKKFIALGLLFSLLGDVLLMFTNKSELYFMGGLFAFLMAHLMYITGFFKKSFLQSKYLVISSIGLLLYTALILFFIGPNLGALLPYVIIYIFAIMLLGLVALIRKSFVNSASYLFLLFGALFFIISDSLLALNKFYTDFPFSGVAIMLTYGLAQLLIVYGGITETD